MDAVSLLLALGLWAGAHAGEGRASAISVDAARHAAGAHAHLVSSLPADGDTLAALPERLRLVFSEPIEEAFSEVALAAAGERRIDLEPARDPNDVRALQAELPSLGPGGYRVTWRIVSADGHPVAGSFAFYLAGAAPGPLREAPGPPVADLGAHAGHGTPAGETGEPPLVAALVRALGLGSLMALGGLLALMAWVVPGPFGRLERLAPVLALVAPLLLAADFLLWLQHASHDRRLTTSVLEAALATRSGLVGALRVAVALLVLWAVTLARRPGLGALLAGGALVLSAFTGHPAAIRPELAVPAKAAHLLAVALWLGGLLLLLVSGRSDERFRLDAFRVSGIALGAVIVIGGTGILQALLFLPEPLDALRSTYGRLALGKLAGLGLLVGFGALNRYRLLPELQRGAGPRGLRRSVRLETLVMAAVIVLAAFLAYVSPPSPEVAAAGRASPAQDFVDEALR